MLSLEGLRVLDDAALALLEPCLAQISARAGSVERLVIHNPAADFMVGVDTPWIVGCMERDDFDAIRAFVVRGQRWLRRLDELAPLVVIAVDGLATGAGAEWLAVADAVIATPRTRIGLPETGLGIYPALGGTQRVPRRIGLAAARWMVLTGAYVTAATGLTLGWIDRVVEPSALLDAALGVQAQRVRAARVARAPEHGPTVTPFLRAFATRSLGQLSAPGSGDPESGDFELTRAAARLRRRAPIALRVADELLRASTRLSLAAGLAREIEELATVYATRDALTGLRAGAADRRAARFCGR